jgi:alpha-2-macroglobulin
MTIFNLKNVKNFIFFIILLGTLGCKRNLSKKIENLGWEQPYHVNYISEYSPHVIGSQESIMVRFGKTPDKIDLKKDKNYSPKINPSIDGSFIWQDKNTLVFKPKDKFESNTTYELQLDLEELYNEPNSGEKDLSLRFGITKQTLKLKVNQIEYNGKDDNHLTGSITSTDHSDNKKIESILQVKQNGSLLPIKWSHVNAKTHNFEINKIIRADNQSDLVFTYDGKEIDENFKNTLKVEVVKKDVFKYLGHSILDNESKIVELLFSDPINKQQDLSGLIQINGQSQDLNFEIEGNKVRLYLSESSQQDLNINISQQIKSSSNKLLLSSAEEKIEFTSDVPSVMALRNGIIMPETSNVLFPFQAKNLKFVRVIVTKIFKNNVLQFLESGNMDDTYNLNSVGKEVVNKKINLEEIGGAISRSEWKKYTIDLNKLVNLDQGAIYNIKINFDKSDFYDFECTNDPNGTLEYLCNSSEYYDDFDLFINTNFMASNIGIIGKCDKDNTVNLVLTDIKTGEPMPNIDIELFSQQKQSLAKVKTDQNGFIKTANSEKVSFVIANDGKQYGYLNLLSSNANPLSEFDIEGKEIETGLDAFIYGERGVYRPGDTMHISVMLFNHNIDDQKLLTPNFPVVLKVTDSRGKLQYERTISTNHDHLYYFPVPTMESANTGNWKITAEIGNEKFIKGIKVETVKPNRLKINTSKLDADINLAENPIFNLNSVWLHGAKASNLSANVNVFLKPYEMSFKTHKSYVFVDPARIYEGESFEAYNDQLDDNGQGNYTLNINKELNPPSAMKGVFKTKVFEQSGNFSEDFSTAIIHKYKNYVGIKLPETSWGGHYYKSDQNVEIKAICLNTKGQALPNQNLTVGLYNGEWDWWYTESNYSMLKYNSGQHLGAIKSYNVKTNSKGEATITDRFGDNKNYLVRICNTESGHCTGDFFYTSKWGNPPSNSGAAQLLSISTDKENYNIGEKIKLRIPSSSASKIILSTEVGSKVVEIARISGQEKESIIEIPVTEKMMPNAYFHATVLQPYDMNESKLPLRMYGVVNVNVSDANKKLNPVINAPSTAKPGEKLEIKVSEKNGKSMSYTLAIVDEGLLDLTKHTTPDPIYYFYSKQALGVASWDLYDRIMSKYADEYENVFSIGGDASIQNINTVKKADRFVPVVKFLGPFTLKNGTQTHHTIINNYVGSVKVMVVAKSEKEFGNAEKIIQIKQDIMVQNTLPRVLSPGDEIGFSTNVFNMSNGSKNIGIQIAGNGFSHLDEKAKNISLNSKTDALSIFSIKANDIEGMANIESRIQSGNLKAEERNQIQVRNPNEARKEFVDIVVEPGKTKTQNLKFFGLTGSNQASFEVSSSPNINLHKRLEYLSEYPYGCLEQITSSAFPQLYLSDMMDLSQVRKGVISSNISSTIQRISNYQMSNGGFSYWPGQNNIDEWITNYVGHFLIEAKNKSYYVNPTMLEKWSNYQKNKAVTFNGTFDYNYILQAYRLYALAKYGKPEMASMNRLRNIATLDNETSHILAASYAIIGKDDVAKLILNKVKKDVGKSKDYDFFTYGSSLRNLSMIAEAYTEMKNPSKALGYIKAIEREVNGASWQNTHALGYGIMALNKFYAKSDGDVLVEYSFNKQKENIKSAKKILSREFAVNAKTGVMPITLKNNGKSNLYVRLNIKGKDPIGIIPASENHVKLNVKYTDNSGSIVDPSNLNIGTSFYAVLTIVNNNTYFSRIDNMALKFIVPAGWEIGNDRLANIDTKNTGIEYQQILDDRVNSFFDLYKTIQIKIPLIATYKGRYYFPSIRCESMYVGDVYAQTNSSYVTIGGEKKAQ